jgi:hypothetical protein
MWWVANADMEVQIWCSIYILVEIIKTVLKLWIYLILLDFSLILLTLDDAKTWTLVEWVRACNFKQHGSY